MDLLLTALRVTHILSAFVWVGMGLTMVFFVSPAMRRAGPAGPAFMRALITATPFSTAIAAASGLTVLAGILMYAFGNSASHFTQTGNIVLGIGAVAGLLGFLHGALFTGRTTSAMKALLLTLPADGPPPPDKASQLQALGAKMASHQPISMLLMIVALLGMGLARYL